MRRLLRAALLTAALTAMAPSVRAQDGGKVTRLSGAGNVFAARAYSGAGSYFGAPGSYGMAYGVASFGVPRTHSAFSSPYGLGYGYGYPPSGFVPGPFGAGLWRPGAGAPGFAYYQTFPVPRRPLPDGPGAPVGAYAPGFGPPAFYIW